MSDLNPTPEFENMLRAAVSPPDPDPDFVNDLRFRLSKEASRIVPQPRRISPRLAWSVVAVVLFVFVIGMLALSPQGAAAMKRLRGYIPGLGIVERSAPLRVLEEPVTVRRNGVQVRVEKGVADSEKTVLLIEVEGLQPALDPAQDEIPICEGMPQLLTSGGAIPVGAAEGFGWETGYTQRMVFPGIPLDENQVNLEIPCLLQLVPGEWAQDWEIPLYFVPAAGLEIAPVIELPAPPSPEPVQPTQTTETARTVEPDRTSGVRQLTPPVEPPALDFGISLTIDQYVELETGYVLIGSLRWTGPQVRDYGVMAGLVTVQDANGKDVPYLEVSPGEWPAPEEQRIAWAYQIEGKDHAWPLTVEIDALLVDIHLAEPASFSFDPGPDPQIGQSWELNLEVPVGGYHLRIQSARAIQEPFGGGAAGYEFTIESDGGVVGAQVMDLQNPPTGGGGGGGGSPGEGPFKAVLMYPGSELPSGPGEFAIVSLTLVSPGPWQATWSPGEP